jgi:hypothetical protein
MRLKDLLFALKVTELIRAIEIAYLRLKLGKKGDQAAFSCIRFTIDGVRYEVRGVIERLD